jgi:hypothetical protein
MSKLTGFPSHDASEKEKAEKSWGLQAAKAIWSDSKMNGLYGMFYHDREKYSKLLEYAMGQQDSDKSVLGINPQNEKQNWVKGVSWQAVDFISKRVNIVVEKLHSIVYDPIAKSIDPLSIERREDLKARLNAFVQMKEFLAESEKIIGEKTGLLGMEEDEVPQNSDDIEIYTEINHKWKDEIFIEEGISYHLEKNDWDHVSMLLDFDLFVFGIACAYVGMDESNLPKICRRDPARMIMPTSEFPNYSDAEYGAYVEDYTVSDFKRMAADDFDKDTISKIVEKYAKQRPDRITHYRPAERYKLDHERDTYKISIMHFEVKTTNLTSAVEMKDKFGNERYFLKSDQYYSTEKEMEKFKEKYGDSRKIDRRAYTCVYRGYWILESDYVFGYGKKYNNTGELSYKVYAPNMRHNRVVSPIEKIIPHADALDRYDKKIQQIVASAIPKGLRIDINALEASSIKMGSKEMGPKDILEMYMQSGILLVGTPETETSHMGGKVSPVEPLENGMAKDIVNYLQLMQFELQQIDEIIGMNPVSSASRVHQDTGKAVTEQMNMATEVSLGYLYSASKQITKNVFSELSDLHVLAVRYNPDMFYPKFGDTHVKRMQKEFNRRKYGIFLEARPTKGEWNEFYIQLKEYVKMGIIGAEDELLIRRVENLKKAEAYLRTTIRRRQRQQAEAEQANMQMNAQVQQQSAQLKAQMDAELKKLEAQLKQQEKMMEAELTQMKHEHKMAELTMKANLDGEWKIKAIREEGEEKQEQIMTKGGVDQITSREKTKKVQEP